MTLNAFLVARCTSTFLPLGALAISSTAHCPSIVVQPSIPFAPKSNFSVCTLSGTFELLRIGRRAESRPPGARHEHGHRGFEHPSTRDIHGSSLFPYIYIQRRGDSTWAAPRGCLAWPARAWCR